MINNELLEMVVEYSGFGEDFKRMGELDSYFEGYRPSEIVEKVFFGNGFNPSHEYFEVDAYDNISSFNQYEYENRLSDCINLYFEDIKQYIIDVKGEDSPLISDLEDCLD